ncbi:MAG: carboxypeptidase-like regulatory domain-containing protein [Bacteroidales bacterium]|nr:carboxypeptidase-like regulatory domain-containing protein [Bacteroidales bacterium]
MANLMRVYILLFITLISNNNVIYSQSKEEKNKVKGIVISQKEKKPVALANVRIKDTPFGTSTDDKGKFEFSFPNRHLKDTLLITCLGYKDEYIPISSLNLKEVIYVELEDSLILLSEIDALAYDYIDLLKWRTKKSEHSQLYLTFATRDIQNAVNFINILKEHFGKDYKIKSNYISWKKLNINDLPPKSEVWVSWFRCPYCSFPENITVIIDVLDKKGNSLCENTMFQNNLKKYFQRLLDKTFAQGVDHKQLVIKDSLAYLQGDEQPYTGQCFGYFENGQKGLKGYYKNGKKDGYWEYWYSNGNKKIEGYYVNGKKQGTWIYYYSNGNIRIKANYVNDEMDGINVWYYENGKKKKEVLFREGVYLEKTEWDENGNVIEKRTFSK